MSLTASAFTRCGLPALGLRSVVTLARASVSFNPWIGGTAVVWPAPSRPLTTTAATAAAGPSAASTAAPTTASTTPAGPKVQPFDFTALAAAVAELRALWVPARIEEAVQYSPCAVALRLRTMERTMWLYLSWHPTLAHVGVAAEGPPRGSAAAEFGFGEQLHDALRGLILTGVTLPQAWERTMALEFAPRPGENPSIIVYAELIGRFSNVVLTEAKGRTVLAAGHQVGVKMSSVRAVYVGRPYAPPPPPGGIPPTAVRSLEEWKAAVMGVDKPTLLSRCTRTFQGVSPSLMRELCAAAGVSPNADVMGLEDAAWAALYARWQAWLQRLDSGSFACACDTATGSYTVLSADSSSADDASPLAFLRSYYGAFEGAEEFDRAKQRVVRGIAAAITRLEKKMASLEAQAADPAAHYASSRVADLLMANLHAIDAKAESVTVEDWDTGEPVTIALDPGNKTPIEVAEELYRKARKQRRAGDQVAPLLEEAQQQLEYLRDAECMVGQLEGGSGDDLAALREAEAEMVAGGFMKPAADAALAGKAAKKAGKAAKKKGGGSPGPGEGYRRYASPSGYDVLVGRNSTQNDQLTLKVAQPNVDVWMHARGVPGAHVLLRVPPGRAAADEDLQFAADLAAYFSKGRTEGKLDVTIANPAHITKPKGAKLGQVLVRQERVLVGRPGKSVAAAAGEE